jgi:hypothetical protein
MTEEEQQAAHDEWQTRLYEATYRLSVALRELHDSNPWPHLPALRQAVDTLATELWDRCFPLSEIKEAFEAAAADLPRYAAGEEVRP